MQKILVANWKMHFGIRESVAQARAVSLLLRGKEEVPDVIVCPSFPALEPVVKALGQGSRVRVGAQNICEEASGAYTGEVSARQVEETGAKVVLIGHAERRARGEGLDAIREKIVLASQHHLTPIVCVAEDAVSDLKALLTPLGQRPAIFVAYEPSVGSTVPPPAPEEVAVVHQALSNTLKSLLSPTAFEHSRILFGGGVDEHNAYSFLREPSINGLLIGRASLRISSFSGILQAAFDLLSA